MFKQKNEKKKKKEHKSMKFHIKGIRMKKILIIHPWFFTGEKVIEVARHLTKYYKIIAPDLSDHNNDNIFISAKDEAKKIEEYLVENKMTKFEAVNGFSLGGRVTLELINSKKLEFKCIVIDSAPVVEEQALLSKLLARSNFIKRKNARGDARKIVEEKMGKNHGKELGKFMVDVLVNMQDDSIKNISRTVAVFPYYKYPKEVQEKMYFEFGSSDTVIIQVPKIHRHYPHANINIHFGYGHCEYVLKEQDKYVNLVRGYIKNSEQIAKKRKKKKKSKEKNKPKD